MSEWKEYKLNEITEPIKETYNPDGSNGFAYIGLEHIEQETLRLNSVGISSDVTSNKFKFKSNDILFGKLRPYFRKVVQPNFEGICSTDIWVFRAKKDFDQNFLFYFLANWDFVNTANSGESGTRMPRADWNFLKTTEWNFPPLPEQQAIAEVLSSLDDKIDLLHRQNKTLEKLAQTLFRQLFVEEAEESWEEKSILEFPTLKLLKPNIVNFEGEKFYLATADVKETKIVNTDIRITYDNRPIRANMQPVINSIWFAKMNDSPKYILIDENTKDLVEHYIFSTGFYGIQIKKGLYFVWNFINTDDFENQKQSNISGSVMEALNNEGLKSISLKLPPTDLIEDFENKVNPYYLKISKNISQIKTLEKLRDTLLPKLISGEVRVSI